MNIGHGFDIHRLEVGAHLVIGGVDIPWTHGLVAVSYTHLTLPTKA